MSFSINIQTNIDNTFCLKYEANIVPKLKIENKCFEDLEPLLSFLTDHGKKEIFLFLDNYLSHRKKHLKPFLLVQQQLQSLFAFEKALLKIKEMDLNLKQTADYILHASHIIQYMLDLYNVTSTKGAYANSNEVEAFEAYLYAITQFRLNPNDYEISSNTQ